jgi:hypothetical protein
MLLEISQQPPHTHFLHGVGRDQPMPFLRSRSEHRIIVIGFGRDDLQHVPMFNDFAVAIKAKDVDSGPIMVPWPFLEAVKYDIIALSNHAFEMHLFAGICARCLLEIIDEALFPIRDAGIVLTVLCTSVALYCFSGLGLIEHQIVERHGSCLIFFEISHTAGPAHSTL